MCSSKRTSGTILRSNVTGNSLLSPSIESECGKSCCVCPARKTTELSVWYQRRAFFGESDSGIKSVLFYWKMASWTGKIMFWHIKHSPQAEHLVIYSRGEFFGESDSEIKSDLFYWKMASWTGKVTFWHSKHSPQAEYLVVYSRGEFFGESDSGTKSVLFYWKIASWTGKVRFCHSKKLASGWAPCCILQRRIFWCVRMWPYQLKISYCNEP